MTWLHLNCHLLDSNASKLLTSLACLCQLQVVARVSVGQGNGSIGWAHHHLHAPLHMAYFKLPIGPPMGSDGQTIYSYNVSGLSYVSLIIILFTYCWLGKDCEYIISIYQ